MERWRTAESEEKDSKYGVECKLEDPKNTFKNGEMVKDNETNLNDSQPIIQHTQEIKDVACRKTNTRR